MAGAAKLVTGKQKQSLDCGNMWRPCMCRQVVTSVNCAVNIVHPRMHTKYTRLVIIKVLNRIRSSFINFLFMFILIILGYRNREEINSMITSGEDGKFQCTVCGHQSNNKNNLQKHIDAKHIVQDPISCQYCEKLCPSQNALNSHISRYHNSSRY